MKKISQLKMSKIKDNQENSDYNFLFKNVFWLTIATTLSRSVSLITLPIITIYLEPKALGIITLFTIEASLLAGLSSLGLHAFVGRMIYKYDRRNNKKCQQYLGIMLFYLIIFSIVGVGVSLPLAKILKKLIFKDVFFSNVYLFYIPLIYAFFENIHGFTTNCFLDLQLNRTLFICYIVEMLLLFPIEIIGLVWFGFGWREVVILQFIVKIIITLFSLWLIRKRISFSFKRLKIIKYAIRYSLPYIPLNISSWIQQQIDKIFLGRLHSVSFVGVYSVSEKITSIFGIFSRPIVTTIKPEISKRLDSRKNTVQSEITDFFNLFFQLSLFMVFSMSLFSREITTIFTNVQYANASIVVPFSMFAYMFSELSGILQLKFVYKNKTIFFPVTIFLGALTNVILNYFLIPRFNILGAGFASALANLIVLFITYFISQRLHCSRYNMIKNFTALILVTFFMFIIQNFFRYSLTLVIFKCSFIIFYGIILYKCYLYTNRRFVELRNVLINIVKTYCLIIWRFLDVRRKSDS